LTILFLVVALKTQRSPTLLRLFYCQNKTDKAVIYGTVFIFCSHYYRSKAIGRAVDLPARSFELARPRVSPPLVMCHNQSHCERLAVGMVIQKVIVLYSSMFLVFSSLLCTMFMVFSSV